MEPPKDSEPTLDFWDEIDFRPTSLVALIGILTCGAYCAWWWFATARSIRAAELKHAGSSRLRPYLETALVAPGLVIMARVFLGSGPVELYASVPSAALMLLASRRLVTSLRSAGAAAGMRGSPTGGRLSLFGPAAVFAAAWPGLGLVWAAESIQRVGNQYHLRLVAEAEETPTEELLRWNTLAVGVPVNRKTRQAILDHCKEGEEPRFVIGGVGALAVFEDRCLIVKAGGLTGFLAGATFGERVTTFMYRHVTGIEYNSGMVNGVLTVLTPSYQGTANQDFWSGTTKGRNADAGDPFTLSNCLPLAKTTYREVRTQIEELRQLIEEQSRTVIMVA